MAPGKEGGVEWYLRGYLSNSYNCGLRQVVDLSVKFTGRWGDTGRQRCWNNNSESGSETSGLGVESQGVFN